MTEEPKIDKLAEALALAQGSFSNPAKDRENPYFHSRYATLDALQDATREALSKNGLCVTQVGRQGVNGWELHTMLLHSSGQYVTSAFPLTAFPKGSQAAGSEITYMRRYAYAAILNVTADEDDDANGATSQTTNIPDPNKLPQRSSKLDVHYGFPGPGATQAQNTNIPDPNRLPQRPQSPSGAPRAVIEAYNKSPLVESLKPQTAPPNDGDRVQGKISDIGTAADGTGLFFKIGDNPAWTRDREMMVQLVKMQGMTVKAHLRKKTPESKSYQLISFTPSGT